MNIAIAGYGVEGKSSYNYFLAQGHTITILDQRSEIDGLPANAKVVLGKNAFSDLEKFDMVVRTPSLSPEALKSAKKIWSVTNEFFAHCPASIIGVTGTKGKGTTSSLIASILKKSGKNVHLVGNIGKPALDVLDSVSADDVVVYELSSFQLWDIEKSPHIAVVLMIEPDHLDVHASFEEYIQAKQNIVRFQTSNDIVVFNNENNYASTIAASSDAHKIPIQTGESVHVADGYFCNGGEIICSTENLKLPGAHNQDNACAAIAAIWPYVQDGRVIAEGMKDFTGLPHRLKFTREVNGVKYYDDSIATTAGSAIAAMKSFSEPKIIILGGASKGEVDYEALTLAAAKSNVKKVLLIGEQASKIQKPFEKYGVMYENLGSNIMMTQVVQRAFELATPNDVVLLSPAHASYDMFNNYADRGDQFVQAVNEL
jgi:UDP-N-acetylmuramoylalanine--D-glutamate ligase